jgi:hypothetical protein
MRIGAMLSMKARGRIERKDSSKSKVKSKAPRQSGPAHGPNVSSTKEQLRAELDAIALCSSVVKIGSLRSVQQVVSMGAAVSS